MDIHGFDLCDIVVLTETTQCPLSTPRKELEDVRRRKDFMVFTGLFRRSRMFLFIFTDATLERFLFIKIL